MNLELAFVTGLAGTVHCAAMCGPLAMAGAAGGRGPAYLAGRFVSYAAVGALMGAVGQHALCLLPVGAVQLAAVAMVGLFAAWKLVAALRPPPGPRPVALGRRRPPLLGRLLALAPRRGFGLGLVTGILPCGMLIPAWTLAMASSSPLAGAAMMAAFCAGSAPGLIVPLLVGWRVRVPRWAQAAAWGALLVWTVARPLLTVAHSHH